MKLVILLVGSLVTLSANAANYSFGKSYSPDEYRKLVLCSEQYCDGSDQGISFRKSCQIEVLPTFVWAEAQPDQNCYCPCTLQYMIDSEQN